MMTVLFIFCILGVVSLAYALSGRARVRALMKELDDERRTVRELAVLNEISSLFYKDLDEGSMIQTIVDKSKELIRSEFSAIMLLEKQHVTGFFTSVGDGSLCKHEPVGILERVMKEGMPVRGRDLREIEGFKGLPDDHAVKIRSILVVPVLRDNDLIGEIILANRIGMEEFSPKDEDLLLTLAFYASSALERARHHYEVKQLACLDGLTGLLNHRTFQESLGVEIERAKRFKQNMSLLMIDIDFFKRLNDTYGHRAGDEVLKKVACRLTENIRNIDVAARYGGEEFVVILPETHQQGALITAERVRTAFVSHAIKIGADEISLTVSIGVATYPGDAIQREALIEKADRALYAAKNAGRNAVCSFSGMAAT